MAKPVKPISSCQFTSGQVRSVYHCVVSSLVCITQPHSLEETYSHPLSQLKQTFITNHCLLFCFTDTRSFVSRSSVSPAKQVNFVSSIRLEPKEPTPPPPPIPPPKVDDS